MLKKMYRSFLSAVCHGIFDYVKPGIIVIVIDLLHANFSNFLILDRTSRQARLTSEIKLNSLRKFLGAAQF